jgi:hypothetical protein
MRAKDKATSMNFPKPSNTIVNMMPMLMGRKDSLPAGLHGYWPMIERCRFDTDATVYLTVHESIVPRGETQRRSGIHTDATMRVGWGCSPWGGGAGIYLASTDGDCRVWDLETDEVDDHGALRGKLTPERSRRLAPMELAHIGDRNPHESLPALATHFRQFFRLVGPDVGGWWVQHSTPNPLGVEPRAPLIRGWKF